MTATQFKRKRERLGYSQAAMAILLDVTVRTVSRWETGEAEIPRTVELAINSLAPPGEAPWTSAPKNQIP